MAAAIVIPAAAAAAVATAAAGAAAEAAAAMLWLLDMCFLYLVVSRAVFLVSNDWDSSYDVHVHVCARSYKNHAWGRAFITQKTKPKQTTTTKKKKRKLRKKKTMS